jgi:hypothetical protein
MLAVGLLHAKFNASGQMRAIPGGWQNIPAMIIVTLAVIAYHHYRGRSFSQGYAPTLAPASTPAAPSDSPPVPAGG